MNKKRALENNDDTDSLCISMKKVKIDVEQQYVRNLIDSYQGNNYDTYELNSIFTLIPVINPLHIPKAFLDIAWYEYEKMVADYSFYMSHATEENTIYWIDTLYYIANFRKQKLHTQYRAFSMFFRNDWLAIEKKLCEDYPEIRDNMDIIQYISKKIWFGYC